MCVDPLALKVFCLIEVGLRFMQGKTKKVIFLLNLQFLLINV